MTAPLLSSVADHARAALCQQEEIEQLYLVANYARIAAELCELGDGPGSDYALRRMGAHARAAISARNHLLGKDDDDAGGAAL